MFFRTTKRTANEIAIAIQSQLRPPFGLSKYLSADGAFNPPPNFWSDRYVIGFVYRLVWVFITLQFEGNRMPARKQGEIAITALKQICGEHWRDVAEAGNKLLNAPTPDPEFIRGTNDAETLYGAYFGRLRADDPDPILKEALLIAKQSVGTKLGLGLISTEAEVGAAVAMLTIHKHIKAKYRAELPFAQDVG